MRPICASVLVLSLFAGPALAAETPALAPGHAAGVREAQKGISGFWVVSGGAALLGLGAFLISTQHSTTASIAFSASDNPVVPLNVPVSSNSTTTSSH